MKNLLWKITTLASVGSMVLALPALGTTGTEKQEREERGERKRLEFTTSSTGTVKNKPVIDLVCMQTAVAKRDATIVNTVDKMNTAWKTALQTRSTSLVNAWKLEERKERRAALVAANKAYVTAKRQALATFKTEKNNAWKTFLTERKACGQASISDDPTNSNTDSL